MRIGIYAPNMASPAPSGVERYITELLAALAERDTPHEFVLLSDRPDLPLPPGGRRVALRTLGRFARVRFDYGPLARLARDEKLDVLHCTKSILPPKLACRGISTVYDVIFLKRPEFYPFLWRLYWNHALRWTVDVASLVIAMSGAVAHDLEKLLPASKGKLRTVKTGIRRGPFQGTAEADAKRLEAASIRTPYFLSVGNITRRKNLPVLLDAFQAIRSRTEARLVIAGALEFGGAEILGRLNGTEGVSYLGRIDEELLAALYRRALGFVYPSEDEGFGLPLLEAMAAGTPVITTSGRALLETAGDAALSVAPGSAPDLAYAMLRLATHEALRADLIRKGEARVAEHTWSRTAAETVAAYEEAGGRG
jgi:glycosyltransferase involved in cell wall biosynthesis